MSYDGAHKIIGTLKEAKEWIKLHRSGRIGVTNGCFDILHAGHIHYLTHARSKCSHLIVLLNSDTSVKRLKGPGRPINPDIQRATVVAALEMVSMVFIFNESRITKWITEFKPDVWFKGGDYTLETLDKKEVQAARRAKCEIALLQNVQGLSTTKIYERIKKTLG